MSSLSLYPSFVTYSDERTKSAVRGTVVTRHILDNMKDLVIEKKTDIR
jgi:hypothetical protein